LGVEIPLRVAQRALCAATIFARAAADIVRPVRVLAWVPLPRGMSAWIAVSKRSRCLRSSLITASKFGIGRIVHDVYGYFRLCVSLGERIAEDAARLGIANLKVSKRITLHLIELTMSVCRTVKALLLTQVDQSQHPLRPHPDRDVLIGPATGSHCSVKATRIATVSNVDGGLADFIVLSSTEKKKRSH
jgi:hypothetical protein